MKILQQVKLQNQDNEEVELETLYDDEILLRITGKSFSYSTKINKRLLKEFIEKI